MPGTIRCISLWQPWASLVALGAKTIETRHWPTSYRGPIAVHAAKTTRGVGRIGDVLALGDFEVERDRSGLLLRGPSLAWPYRLPLGAVVAVGRLDAVDVMDEAVIRAVPEAERPYGHYAYGRFAWRLADVRPLRQPVEVTGRQGLFDVPLAALPEEVRP